MGGRFGMKPEKEYTEIIALADLNKYAASSIITDIIHFTDDYMMISFLKKDDSHYTNNFENEDRFKMNHMNVNVAIASAITSYARIYLSYLEYDLNINVYNKNTDSLHVDKPLPVE